MYLRMLYMALVVQTFLTALTDADAFTVSNIGSSADDTDNMKGYIKNIIIYKGTVLTAAERQLMYTYLT